MTNENVDQVQLTNGVWMSVSLGVGALLVPRLFADHPITLSTDGLAVCRPEQITEPGVPGLPPLKIVPLLGKGRGRVNLLLVLGRPMLFPSVRLRARFGVDGFLCHHARDRPHDGYHFHSAEPDRVIEPDATRRRTQPGPARVDGSPPRRISPETLRSGAARRAPA